MEDQEQAPIQPTQLPVAAAPMNEQPLEKSQSKSGILIILVLLLLLLAGIAGIFAYAFLSNKNIPIISDIVEQVENVAVSDEQFAEMVQDQLSEAIFSTIEKTSSVAATEAIVEIDASEEFLNNYAESTTKGLSSYRFDSMIDMQITTEDDYYPVDLGIQLSMDGAVQANGDTLKLETNIYGEYAEAETNLIFDGNIKALGEVLYFKINELPDFGVDLDEFLNTWYFLDITEEEDLVTGLKESQGLETDDSISEDDLEKLNQLITGETIKANIVRLPDMVLEDEEKFGESTGTRTNCFELNLDGDDIVALVEEIEKIWEVTDAEKTSSSDKAEIKNTFQEVSMGACVGRQDHQVYKYMFDVALDSEGTAYAMNGWSEMWDHNKDVNIAEPTDAINFEDAIGDILNTVTPEPYGPAAQLSSTRNTIRKSDINAMLQAASLYTIDNDGEFPTINGEPMKTLTIEDGYAYCEEWGECFATDLDEIADGFGAYLTEIPLDPQYDMDYLIGVDDSTNPMHIIVATNYMEEGDDQVGTLYYLEY